MLMIALIVSMLWCFRTAKRKGFTRDHVIDISLLTLILGVIGARLVFILLKLDSYVGRPLDVLKVWEGGLSFHGGVLGGVVAGLWFARRVKRSFWEVADLVTPSLPLGYAIAKWGCFLNGCCYGTPTNLPWACRFPVEGSALHALGPPSHPVQIYDSLLSLLIFAAISFLVPRLKVPGHLFVTYLGLYSVSRIFTEVFRRGVTGRILFDGITEAQVASAVIIVFAVAAWAVLKRRWEQKTAAESPDAGSSPETSGGAKAGKRRKRKVRR